MTPTDKQQAKFTPGPWRLHHRWPDDVVDATGALVVSAYSDYESPQTQGNAHLISAAPELYRALEAMLDSFCSGGDLCMECGENIGSGDACETCQVTRQAQAALAKARGQK